MKYEGEECELDEWGEIFGEIVEYFGKYFYRIFDLELFYFQSILYGLIKRPTNCRPWIVNKERDFYYG